MTRRALTPEDKRVIMQRLLTTWNRRPAMRLGQLIANSLRKSVDDEFWHELFDLEDLDLIEAVEEFTK